MRVTFDSNVWERIFDPAWESFPEFSALSSIRRALTHCDATGFMCDATFRLEAPGRGIRSQYVGGLAPTFAAPSNQQRSNGVLFSIGPDDAKHPGLHPNQKAKVRLARKYGFKVVRGCAWMFLPGVDDEDVAAMLVGEAPHERSLREQLHYGVFNAIEVAGAGKAWIENIRKDYDADAGFEHAGWTALRRAKGNAEIAKIAKAIAEWSDAEVVSAHVGYRNDILCTNDTGRSSSNSVFADGNRVWLSEEFGVRFVNATDLASMLSGVE